MFTNHWIVADMDGTLTPTPTRAHGKYLSLSHCLTTGLGLGARYRSCLPWLRLFVERGGSLCVVSTAGKRMWAQLYQDLAPSVFRAGSPPAGGGDGVEGAPGSLYLCGFTGAAMFRTRPREAVLAEMSRLHPGWQPSLLAINTLSTTAACDGSAEPVVVPPAAVGMEEWAAYRQQAVEQAAALAGTATAADSCSSTTMDTATHTLAFEEGRNAIVRFFEHVSYVSGHDVQTAAAFFKDCLSTKYHAVFTDILRQLLAEAHVFAAVVGPDGTVPHVCFANSAVLNRTALAQHGCFLRETKDALLDAQRVPQPDGTIAEGAPVAQVVVMGIPMRYFEAIFPSSPAAAAAASSPLSLKPAPTWQCCPQCAAVAVGAAARLEAAGLELKSQPNSVCLHRRGVDKGMCVRWLMSQHGRGTFSFDLEKTVAFGDVPETVDRPLTEYPPMQFISLSPKAGAAARLAAMQLPATTTPATPPVWLYQVGGEEEGTALFLEELFASCAQDGGDVAVPQGGTWFTPSRVSACAARAQASLAAELAARSSAGDGSDTSRSTL